MMSPMISRSEAGRSPCDYAPLAARFKRHGFDFELICRVGPIAIYKRSRRNHSLSFEVVVLRPTPERTLPDGTIVPAKERYPTSLEWGEYGWSCTSLDRAQAKFRQLTGMLRIDRRARPKVHPAVLRRGDHQKPGFGGDVQQLRANVRERRDRE
jgi:hypothetical protein